MERTERGTIFLNYGDLIRLNRLVRDRIDYEAFKRWYDSLSTPEQAALISVLCEFTIQAGFDDHVYYAAIADAGLESNHPILMRAESFHTPGRWLREHQTLYQWASQLNDTDRATVFKYFVFFSAMRKARPIKHVTAPPAAITGGMETCQRRNKSPPRHPDTCSVAPLGQAAVESVHGSPALSIISRLVTHEIPFAVTGRGRRQWQGARLSCSSFRAVARIPPTAEAARGSRPTVPIRVKLSTASAALPQLRRAQVLVSSYRVIAQLAYCGLEGGSPEAVEVDLVRAGNTVRLLRRLDPVWHDHETDRAWHRQPRQKIVSNQTDFGGHGCAVCSNGVTLLFRPVWRFTGWIEQGGLLDRLTARSDPLSGFSPHATIPE